MADLFARPVDVDVQATVLPFRLPSVFWMKTDDARSFHDTEARKYYPKDMVADDWRKATGQHRLVGSRVWSRVWIPG